MKNSEFKLKYYFKVFSEHKAVEVELFQKTIHRIYGK